jgi:hypothetical protein
MGAIEIFLKRDETASDSDLPKGKSGASPSSPVRKKSLLRAG